MSLLAGARLSNSRSVYLKKKERSASKIIKTAQAVSLKGRLFIGRAVRFFSFSLEYCRDVSGEYREENHTRGGENDGKDLPDLRDPENIRPDRGDVHQRPVESVPVCFHGRVNTVFQ